MCRWDFLYLCTIYARLGFHLFAYDLTLIHQACLGGRSLDKKRFLAHFDFLMTNMDQIYISIQFYNFN